MYTYSIGTSHVCPLDYEERIGVGEVPWFRWGTYFRTSPDYDNDDDDGDDDYYYCCYWVALQSLVIISIFVLLRSLILEHKKFSILGSEIFLTYTYILK